MLRILSLADDLILPQAKQEIYFFNRIGQKRTFNPSVTVQSNALNIVASRYVSLVSTGAKHPNTLLSISRSSARATERAEEV